MALNPYKCKLSIRIDYFSSRFELVDMLEKAAVIVFFGIVVCYEKSTVSRCLWHINKCVEFCPEWMVEIKSDCSKSYWRSQATCDSPQPKLVGTVCGFSRCDCPNHMVLDTDTGYCYDVDNCPTKHIK